MNKFFLLSPITYFHFLIPLSCLSYPTKKSSILTCEYNWEFQTIDKKKSYALLCIPEDI